MEMSIALVVGLLLGGGLVAFVFLHVCAKRRAG
jgi:hypothetical protein